MANSKKTNDKRLSGELQRVLKHITSDLTKEFPTDKITTDYLVLSMLDLPDCVGGKVMARTMLTEAIDKLREKYCGYLINRKQLVRIPKYPKFDTLYDECMAYAQSMCKEGDCAVINSGHVLLAMLDLCGKINKDFTDEGVTVDEIKEAVEKETADLGIDNTSPQAVRKTILKKHKKKSDASGKPSSIDISSPLIIKTIKPFSGFGGSMSSNEVENNLKDLNKLAIDGLVDPVYGRDALTNQVFSVLSKRDRNNVVLVGLPGVGKTAIARNIANILVSDKCPKPFKGKKLMEMDFLQMTSNTAYQGALEMNYKAIIEQARKKGNYIFFLDNIHDILSERQRYGGIETILNIIMAERGILFITTTNPQDYKSYIEGTSMEGYSQKIQVDEPSVTDAIGMVSGIKWRYEDYHNVSFTDEDVETAVKLAKRYISERHLPASAIEILDEAGAERQVRKKDPQKIRELEAELKMVMSKKKFFDASPEESKNYDVYDSLTKQEISVKAQLAVERKIERMHGKKDQLPVNEIFKMVEEKTGIPLEQITVSDREALKGLDDKLKKYVIGQDKAVEEVCRVVRRQRVGMANPNKPAVLFFGGATGCGKTYLAKKLAEEVFGDEKYLVKLDMSEYSEKFSTSRLFGSAPGYVGYENGGQLTEAIKKKKYCVLLLDEIEKADEQVHNVFLQLFDEGRLTDNQGVTVDFKNVIVIMTSNVGAREVSERGKGFGVVKNGHDKTESIIEEALKEEFKPEFLNRIDQIVYFNRLTDDNYKSIISLELGKVKKKVEGLGLELDKGFTSKALVNKLFSKVKDETEMGARPIARIVQSEVEDKIADYLIDNELGKGQSIPVSILS